VQSLREIVSEGLLLARHITNQDLKNGLNFFTQESDQLQVGSWRYAKGKTLAPHIHNYVKRESDRTQECVIVVAGSIKVTIYTERDEILEEIVVNAGQAMILLRGGHGYEILEDETVVFEIKNGPYPGAEIDRRRI
jgi:cupin fold WbuC family metalloprotein